MCVALAALDAVIHVRGATGERAIAFDDFYLLPGQTPAHETVLEPGDLIVGVELPEIPFAKKSHYLKVRDRESYEFALASAAAALEIRDGTIVQARLALGGVATKPWRAYEAEKVLKGAKADAATFAKAAEAELQSAHASPFNGFKIDLAKRTIVRALSDAGSWHERNDHWPARRPRRRPSESSRQSDVCGRVQTAQPGVRRDPVEHDLEGENHGVGCVRRRAKSGRARGSHTQKRTDAQDAESGQGQRCAMPGDEFAALQSAEIYYDGQAVAVVVAETFEEAGASARPSSLKSLTAAAPGEYDVESATSVGKAPKTMFGKELKKKKGDVDAALKNATFTLEETYVTPIQNHCAMEPSATTAEWDGDKLTLYDATQGVMGSGKIVASVLGIAPENVRVVCRFLGGGFGSKGFSWPHTVLAAVASKTVKRPVQLALKRQQNFTNIGHREKCVQKMRLGADATGKLLAIHHVTTTGTSRLTEFTESCGLVSQMLYACPNTERVHRLHALDIGSPTPMRAPGECPGSFALECAMDELAYKAGLDPLEFRLLQLRRDGS